MAERDLTQDGLAERVVISYARVVRILNAYDQSLFEVQIPSHVGQAGVAIHELPGYPPLVHIYWPWCLRSYPDNLFVWYDPLIGAFVADRDTANMTPGRCGVYEYQGRGLFKVLFRHEELSYVGTVRWDSGQLIHEDYQATLLYVEADRLHYVLTELADEDVSNPEVLFADPALYEQFKARTEKGWRFEPAKRTSPGSLTLEAHTEGKALGTLTVGYHVEGRFRSNILITRLEWSVNE